MACNPGSFEAQRVQKINLFPHSESTLVVEILRNLHYNIRPSDLERSEALSVKVLVVFLLVENESESGGVVQSLA